MQKYVYCASSSHEEKVKITKSKIICPSKFKKVLLSCLFPMSMLCMCLILGSGSPDINIVQFTFRIPYRSDKQKSGSTALLSSHNPDKTYLELGAFSLLIFSIVIQIFSEGKPTTKFPSNEVQRTGDVGDASHYYRSFQTGLVLLSGECVLDLSQSFTNTLYAAPSRVKFR